MKTYKHKIYLVERTKLLEGTLCQSITFTNPLGNNYTVQNALPTVIQNSSGADLDEEDISNIINLVKDLYNTPSESENIISANAIGNIINGLSVSSPETGTGVHPNVNLVYVSAQSTLYSVNGNLNSLGADEEITVSNFDNLTIRYNLTFSRFSGGTAYSTELDIAYFVFGKKNTLPLVRWTITDVINRILQLAEPISSPEQARYTLNPIQAEKYSKIFAPEFTMTQCTLREQLKVVGGYIHAEPRLGGYYNGVYEENMIFFDEYGSTEPSEIASAPYVYKGYAQSINQYCTDVQTNASNIVNSLNYAQGVIIDPDINGDRTIRTENVNVKITDNDSAVAYTQLPIYKITKVECGVYNADGDGYYLPLKDISPYIYEAYEYNSILSSYEGNYPYVKAYGIYYTQGEKNLRGLFFKTENAIAEYFSEYAIVNILSVVNTDKTKNEIKNYITNNFPLITFRISYLPVYEAKFSHNKQLIIKGNKKFSQIYNQSENLIETSYYGQNIKGVAQRLGNVEQTRTYILKDITKIPKIGQCIDDYIISAVNTEIQWGYIKCTVALSKDFNRISQYVGINSNKRIAEVSERQAYKRDILLKDFVVIGDAETQNARCFNDVSFALDVFKANVEKNQISAVLGIGYTKNNTRLNIIRLPIISSAFGNSMLFSWNYKDNYSAGEQVSRINDATWQTDVPYCDYYGRIWDYAFGLYNNLNFEKEQAFTPINKVSVADSPIFIPNERYLMRKDSREIPTFNYEVEFVTNRPDLIIGSAMASNNPLVSGIGAKLSEAPKVYFFDEPINKFTNKVDLSKALKVNGVVQTSNITINNNIISFTIPNPQGFNRLIKSWAIVTPIETISEQQYQDEDGNVITETITKGGELLLASNKTGYSIGDTIIIYLTGKGNIYD